MNQCYKGITVGEVQSIVEAIKIVVDDMTPDELRIYKKIRPLIEKQGEKWVDDIVNNRQPNPALRDVIAPILTEELTTTMQRRAANISQTLGTPPLQSDNVLLDWLGNHVPMVTKGIDQTSADVIQKVVSEFRTTPGMTIQDVQSRLSYAYDPNRAKMIAITETTRAASQATTSYQDYLRERGIPMIRVWNTDADELVCPICAPLNGQTEADWGAEYPDGAPAHVNCRCDTTLRLDRDAKPNEEASQISEEQFEGPTTVAVGEQAPIEVPLLQRDAAEIAQYIKDAVPADLAQDARDAKLWRTVGGTQEKLQKAEGDAAKLYGYNSPEYETANKAYWAELARQQNLAITLQAQEEAVYRSVLKDLQHPTPAKANVTFSGVKLTKAQEARINDLIQLSVGIAPDSIYPINIVYKARTGADTVSGAMGGGVMYGHKNSDASTIVHESMHALQDFLGYGIRATDDFAAIRTAGDKPVSLRSQNIGGGGNTYLDSTDSAYTFKIYPDSIRKKSGKFSEVLTTSIDHILLKPTDKDTGLLELFAQIVKDGGK